MVQGVRRMEAKRTEPEVESEESAHSKRSQRLVEAVQADLRGPISTDQMRMLQEQPTAWLGVLRSLERDMTDQIETRRRALDLALTKGSASDPDWPRVLSKHSAWQRKVSFALRRVRKRLVEVVQIAPEAAMRQALTDFCALDPQDAAAVAGLQESARRLLQG